VGLERGSLSLVSTIEELLGRRSSGYGLETVITAVGDPPRSLRDTICPAKALTSPTNGGRSRTQATECDEHNVVKRHDSLLRFWDGEAALLC
jgi:hypothetical protein